MATSILTTKLYLPPPRPALVTRPRLFARLNAGLAAGSKLTLISAPAGFGKTTLLSEWASQRIGESAGEQPVAWLSLDDADSNPTRFWTYFIAALQTVIPDVGAGVADALQSPQPPPIELLLTNLLNEIAAIPERFVLVLDDYHVIESSTVDAALAFLLEHLPSPLHLVIASREDPQLPLARLRARGQLAELRAADLRFTPAEAADFLNRVMGLSLSGEDVAALEARTEGWIAGLQLAALSMQGQPDVAGFIRSFTGSHHFVLDYLVEEVLRRQPEDIQTFLLRTSILDRLCGPLCDAVLSGDEGKGSSFILDTLERANLFIVPLDNDRLWYRYHHLFGTFLRQRLGQTLPPGEVAALHVRASRWHEDNDLALEAFRHATAAGDIDRAVRLIKGKGMPLHFHSVAAGVLDWLASLPAAALDARPFLWVRWATLLLMNGQTTGVEEKLQAAEKALQHVEPDDRIRDLIGQIACARATLALTRYDPETMLVQARRALEYVHPDNLPFRFTANWALASASLLHGDRATAARACREGVVISQKSGDSFSMILATGDLGQIQELDNQLYPAAETYRRVLQLAGEYPQPNVAETYLGLARIHYEWNDLDAAEQYAQQSLQLARQFDRAIDRFIVSEVFLTRLQLARGDVAGAAAQVAQIEQSARQRHFVHRLPEIAAAQVDVLLRQGDVAAAAHLAQKHELPFSRARILLAQGDAAAALTLLSASRQQLEAKGWQDERLKALVLQALAFRARGEEEAALQTLGETLALAEPGGFIRIFVDEGVAMAQLLSEAIARGIAPDYIGRILAAFPDAMASGQSKIQNPKSKMIEPLSQRELEVLRLIAQGLSNREISERLFLALSTVKGHTRIIFDKLQVQRRTEAVARARELGLL
ncbi:MAG TPA: LuxR C-terminal-related transcriptional regulator [Anaerolineae bacterium]|nr:LuxR C-terminal-related transcriptional regulator [Anaerolineae bacterium]